MDRGVQQPSRSHEKVGLYLHHNNAGTRERVRRPHLKENYLNLSLFHRRGRNHRLLLLLLIDILLGDSCYCLLPRKGHVTFYISYKRISLQLHVANAVLEGVGVTADGASGEAAGLRGAGGEHYVAIAVVGVIAEVCRGATSGTAARH